MVNIIKKKLFNSDPIYLKLRVTYTVTKGDTINKTTEKLKIHNYYTFALCYIFGSTLGEENL